MKMKEPKLESQTNKNISLHENNENERMIDAILDIIKCIEVGGQPLSNICTAIESIKIIEGIKKSDKEDLIKF